MTAQNNTEALLQVLLTQTLLDLERCTQEQSARDRDKSSCLHGRTCVAVSLCVRVCRSLCVWMFSVCCGYHEPAYALLGQ